VTGFSWQAAALYLMVINIVTILLFAVDKHRARRRQWRISERTLLAVCLVGGTIGAYWARRKFRHKTRKQPFSNLLRSIAALQVLAAAGAIWLILSGKYL